MKKLNISALKRFEPVIETLKKNRTFISILIVLCVFGFIVYRISYFNGAEPTETAIEEQLKTSTRPKIDKALVEKLVNLESDNIQVKSLFNQVRENPFSE